MRMIFTIIVCLGINIKSMPEIKQRIAEDGH
jgi:hypothetical protein